METVASSHKFIYTDNALFIQKGWREHVLFNATAKPVKWNTRKSLDVKRRLCVVMKESSNTENHVKSLDSYLDKLHNTNHSSAISLRPKTELISTSGQLKADNGSLRLVEDYLRKVKDAESGKYVNENIKVSLNTADQKNQGSGMVGSTKSYMELMSEDVNTYSTSDFYVIGALASMNIAVFLFEIATPLKISNFDLFSIPLLYGAKINNLILTGEWWRLITPMFLHSGIFHIALSSWALFTFGLQVCKDYGSFTFLLIYFLGGISGNLISFLHTPYPTIGGTGPVFAVIGAWLIYQVQNKDVIEKTSSQKMFQKAIIITALSSFLTYFAPVDEWTHFAAAITGIAYGYLTCPALGVKETSPGVDHRQRGITLVGRYSVPCKSLVYFSFFILMLSSLLFIIEPPLDLIQ